MDRYKECERLLKFAVAQQCKERGVTIKQDFAAVGRTSKDQISPIADAGELVRLCFSVKNAEECQVLRKGCDVLIDTLNFVHSGQDPKVINGRRKNNRDISFAGLANLVRDCMFDESDTRVHISHLCDHKNTSSAYKDLNTCVFHNFDDGFYELSVVKNPDTIETVDRSAVSDEVKEAINAYTSGTKGRYSSQGLTILSDDGTPKHKEAGDVDMSDDSLVPKNLHIQQLFGMSGQSHLKIRQPPFDPYYGCSETTGAYSKKDNDVTHHYVGGLYPPQHTYYSNRSKDREQVFTIVSKNCLRRVFCERKPNLADRLMEKGKRNNTRDEAPVALLARATQGEYSTKELLLVNETLIRAKTSPTTAPVEYVAFIGKGIIRTFKCSTYAARIMTNRKSQQSQMCSSLFTSEVEQAKLQSRVLLKLLRYEFAWRNMASHWRNHIDVITKAISNIEWGCMWQDWNFFTGGIVTEIDMQNMLLRLNHFKEQEMDDEAAALRDVCDEFSNHLSTLKKVYETEGLNVSTVVPELVKLYNTKVLGAFQLCYGSIRTGIYTDLKSLHSKMFPHLTPVTTQSAKRTPEGGNTPVSTPTNTVNFIDQEEVLQLRLELLPKHDNDAIDVLTLTSIDDIIGPRLMDHPGLSGEPFLGFLTNPQNLDIKARGFKVTSTAMDLCKKCSDAYTKQGFSMDKRKVAKGLCVLNALVTLLKNSEKIFTSSKNLQEFLGASVRFPAELATWILTLFYERNGTNDFMLNVKGHQKLTCYIMWLCIYLAAGNHTYNFATLRNVDLKTKRKIHAIFDKCVPIAGLSSKTTSKSDNYTIALPLGGIPKTTTSSFKGLMGAISSYGKRPRR